MARSILVLGCGYTGELVARHLLARGAVVHATARDPRRLAALADAGAVVHALDALDAGSVARLAELAPRLGPNLAVLCSIPVLEKDGSRVEATPSLLNALGPWPTRVVYLSTTAVYGDATEVDERSPLSPRTEGERLRAIAERAAAAGPWSSLVLRPAAIYGPGRGVQVAVREGRYRHVRNGDDLVSRIHVEDLAAIIEAALLSGATGAFPVADDEPARSSEVASFCARLLGLAPQSPSPAPTPNPAAAQAPRAGRRVDGRAIRRILGVSLQYPSYRVGIPAAMAAEPLT